MAETDLLRAAPAAGLPRLLEGAWSDHSADLQAHLRKYGPPPVDVSRQALIEVVERSGLSGRGGAGFPTGRKLRSVADAAGGPAVVVANGMEGEPASSKDRFLLTRVPHLVLDGIALAARAVGADRAYLCVHRGEPEYTAWLRDLVGHRRRARIDRLEVEIVELPRRYVASEQSSLVRFIDGGPAVPTFGPRPHERGVRGRPTLVNNVETLAHLALIARHGDRWFRTVGAPHAPGSMLMTITGAVHRPGVYEVPMGLPIGQAILAAGGPAERLKAVLSGGYFGTWMAAEVAWNVRLTHADMRRAGAFLGAGVLIVLPDSACVLGETARVVRYLSEETAGQCGPCVFGLPALADALGELAFTGGRSRAIQQVGRQIDLVDQRGACRHPDGVAALVRSAMEVFADDAYEHDRFGPCEGLRRRPVLPLPPLHEREEARK
ncbi:NADH-ubiquinone oxidoreductase-F iron-sulfur binding region domain-containing protein [Catenulispora subtropica]|uniref:NADH-ubiquinone oxidoreductase-F iron-sulfur binding region domain-containing protein n=1 Tax=Catenulispora subtropica TaxID=450798 RepID=A0ABP5E249_9ACTN